MLESLHTTSMLAREANKSKNGRTEASATYRSVLSLKKNPKTLQRKAVKIKQRARETAKELGGSTALTDSIWVPFPETTSDGSQLYDSWPPRAQVHK